MKQIRRRVSEFLLVAVFVGIVYPDRPLDNVRRFLRVEEERVPVKKYSQDQIEATAPHLEVFHPRLLVWSEDEGFRVYNLDHKDSHYQENMACGRCAKTVPLIVNALTEAYGPRFQPGQPVFQMLWSDADSFQSPCVNEEANCRTNDFSPLPLFGSVPKDPEVLPTIKAMPNWFYIDCLYNWKFGVTSSNGDCWKENVNHDIRWDDLTPTALWRGSDFTFLPSYAEHKGFLSPKNMEGFIETFAQGDNTPESLVMELFDHWKELSPRWRAIALSAQAELYNETWIDAKFVGPIRDTAHEKFREHGVTVAADEHMEADKMSHYKYQLDLGGGGGTSWRGTLTKLEMPGVLLHHETPTQDWWYEEMEEYKHYIPINTDLTDLKAKLQWAAKSDKKAKKISKAATNLATYLFSEKYMKKVHNDLFVTYLGKVVDSYIHNDMPWAESVIRYKNNGFALTEVAYCRSSRCYTNVRDDIYRTFSHNVAPASLPAAAPESLPATENESKNAFDQSQAALVMVEENKRLREESTQTEQSNEDVELSFERDGEATITHDVKNEQRTQEDSEEIRTEQSISDTEPSRIVVNEDREVFFVDETQLNDSAQPETNIERSSSIVDLDPVSPSFHSTSMAQDNNEEQITTTTQGIREQGQVMNNDEQRNSPQVSIGETTVETDRTSRATPANTKSDGQSIVSSGNGSMARPQAESQSGEQFSTGEGPHVISGKRFQNDAIEEVKDTSQATMTRVQPMDQSVNNANKDRIASQSMTEQIEVVPEYPIDSTRHSSPGTITSTTSTNRSVNSSNNRVSQSNPEQIAVAREQPQIISDAMPHSSLTQPSSGEVSVETNERPQATSQTIRSTDQQTLVSQPTSQLLEQVRTGSQRVVNPASPSNSNQGAYLYSPKVEHEVASSKGEAVVRTTQGSVTPRSSVVMEDATTVTTQKQQATIQKAKTNNEGQSNKRQSQGQGTQSNARSNGPQASQQVTSQAAKESSGASPKSSETSKSNGAKTAMNARTSLPRETTPESEKASGPAEIKSRVSSTPASTSASQKKGLVNESTSGKPEKSKSQPTRYEPTQRDGPVKSKGMTNAAREELSQLVLVAEETAII